MAFWNRPKPVEHVVVLDEARAVDFILRIEAMLNDVNDASQALTPQIEKLIEATKELDRVASKAKAASRPAPRPKS